MTPFRFLGEFQVSETMDHSSEELKHKLDQYVMERAQIEQNIERLDREQERLLAEKLELEQAEQEFRNAKIFEDMKGG